MNDPEPRPTLFKKKWQVLVFLSFIFIIALGIRVYDLNDLPLDFHPARQFQSMLKARGMYYAAAAVPDWQKAMAVKQWQSQPVQEPEVVENLAVFTYKIIGREDIWFPRFYSILFWLAGGLALYLLLKNWISEAGAVVGTLYYLFVPYGISASRTFMPDPLMIALLLWSVWAVFRWSEKPGWGRAVLAGVLCGLTIYVKLTAVFYVGGAILGLALGRFGFRQAIKNPQLWVMGIMALLPGLVYNVLGIFVFKFISSDAVNNRLIPSLLVNPVSYLQWNSMIAAVPGAVAFFLGVAGIFLLNSRAKRSLLAGLWLGYLVFGIFFIYYYTTHDYYHVVLIPLTAMGLAAIGDVVLQKMDEFIRPGWFARVLVLGVLLACVGETVWQVRNDFKRTDYRSQAQFWQKLGDELRGSNSLAMADDYNGRLEYYGWYETAYMPDLGELTHRALTGHSADIAATFAPIAQGRDFFLVTLLDDLNAEPDFKAYLDQTFPVYDKGDGYIIYDLRQQK